MKPSTIRLIETLLEDDMETVELKLRHLRSELNRFKDLADISGHPERYSGEISGVEYSIEYWLNINDKTKTALADFKHWRKHNGNE
jgi:hypothetical protein